MSSLPPTRFACALNPPTDELHAPSPTPKATTKPEISSNLVINPPFRPEILPPPAVIGTMRPSASRRKCEDNPLLHTAEIYLVGNRCLTLPMSAQASFLRCFLRLSTVNWLPPVVRGSASHDTGTETGAPARARVEKGATDVASRELRK